MPHHSSQDAQELILLVIKQLWQTPKLQYVIKFYSILL